MSDQSLIDRFAQTVEDYFRGVRFIVGIILAIAYPIAALILIGDTIYQYQNASPGPFGQSPPEYMWVTTIITVVMPLVAAWFIMRVGRTLRED